MASQASNSSGLGDLQSSKDAPLNDEDDLVYDSEEGDLSKIQRSRKQQLGLSGGYAPDWGLCEGFREIFQNWRDGILQAFKLKERDFKPNITEKKHLISVEVFHPTSKNLLGYIRFKYDKDNNGTLEMTNFDASLELWHLSLGGTSKSTDDSQAGQHGEGLKMAALVFLRGGNHSFRITSSRFTWSFNFDQRGKLCCVLTRVNENSIIKQRRIDRNKARTTTARAYQDVCITIGQERNARDPTGSKIRTRKIPLAEFRKWMEVSIDLQSPTSVIRTAEGDVIMDLNHNKLYLRGLLLPKGSSTGKDFRYGYNLLRGKTNRDRQSLAGTYAEAQQILKIWSSAIRNEEPDALATYTELLLASSTRVADVMVQVGNICPEQDIASKIWNHMLSMRTDKQDRTAFYYSADDGQDNIHIIVNSLKKAPVLIKSELWKIFRKFELCRTPAEEQYHIFSTAPVLGIPDNGFAGYVDWILECFLRSRESTKDIQYEFVDARDTAIDCTFENSKWRIHGKWLTYDGAHEATCCDKPVPSDHNPFCCDHVVYWLWDLMMKDAVAQDSKCAISNEQCWLKSMAHTRLPQMPRNVTCQRTSRHGELLVSWASTDLIVDQDEPVRVTLHEMGCDDATDEVPDHLVNLIFSLHETDRRCECPSQVSSAATPAVTFTDLDPAKSYLAKVSRDQEGAFYGLAPPYIRPYAEDIIKVEKKKTLAPLDDNIQSHTEDEQPRKSSPLSSVSADDDSLHQEPTDMCDSSSDSVNDQSPSCVENRDANHSRDTVDTGCHESYKLGDQLDHGDLAWGDGFPGTHNFYRTRDLSDEDIYIVKPKKDNVNINGKRTLQDHSSKRSGKRRK